MGFHLNEEESLCHMLLMTPTLFSYPPVHEHIGPRLAIRIRWRVRCFPPVRFGPRDERSQIFGEAAKIESLNQLIEYRFRGLIDPEITKHIWIIRIMARMRLILNGTELRKELESNIGFGRCMA